MNGPGRVEAHLYLPHFSLTFLIGRDSLSTHHNQPPLTVANHHRRERKEQKQIPPFSFSFSLSLTRSDNTKP
ncbi:hypothetical protein RIF29_13731 [Crotalaria pallida]|uniref:Uncharacterized protein n=1 Tax=Crotalaria pallida TaxID=3830 RepID=A0AAN9IPZ1_CROPI